MRKSLPDDQPSLRKQLLHDYADALKKVMRQTKMDLKVLSTDNIEHPLYVDFVRDIISLIRSHASDICAVDEFFYQTSKEYSPPLQDPRLYVAGIESYGLRLAEGDAVVAQQLFHYLYNNFKHALANDKLDIETGMLVEGMRKPGILSFVMGTMLPAVIRATLEGPDAFFLLSIYVEALRRLLTASVMPYQVPGHLFQQVVVLVATTNYALQSFREFIPSALSADQLDIARHLVSLVDAMRGFCDEVSFSQEPPLASDELDVELERFASLASTAERCLTGCLRENQSSLLTASALFMLSGTGQSADVTPLMAKFKDHIVNDVRSNWVITSESTTVLLPARGKEMGDRGMPRGTRRKVWDRMQLACRLNSELQVWNAWWQDSGHGEARTSPSLAGLEDCMF